MNHRVLMMFLPYGEESERVEKQISQWLSNPTNCDQYKNLDDAHWSLVGSVVIEGTGRDGTKVRMVAPAPIILSGSLTTVFDK